MMIHEHDNSEHLWVLLYLGELFDGHALDELIYLWTGPWNNGTPPCVHAELGFPDRNESFSFTARKDVKLPYPGTTRTGARFTNLKTMLKNPRRWLVAQTLVTKDDADKCHEYCEGEIGKTYGFGSLALGFALYVGTNGLKSNYCSRGGVNWPLAEINLMDKKAVISPRRVYRDLSRDGFAFRPVTKEMLAAVRETQS